ncbi:DUF4386 domain-containing protein [Candidatus Pacearchaeota archaeon]|nr:DUF4386 domain-containing protein [Candidatus Pacearchaeota archaeon]
MKNKDISQQKSAILLRFLYTFWAIIGAFSLIYIPSKLIVFGDAGTTAKNIITNELLFRVGIVGCLITQLLFIIVALLLYKLFEKVNRNQSILMVVFALVSVPIAMISTLFKFTTLFLVDNFEQMMFFLNLNVQGIIIASIFWGLWLLPLGCLIYKSGYFPKFVGVAVIIGGFGYIIDSFVKIILPNLNIAIIVDILALGEMVFVFWIIIKGVKLKDAK